MPKVAGKKSKTTGPKSNGGVKKSKQRGQKLKDSKLRAQLDKAVQERDEAKERGLNPDENDKKDAPRALSQLVSHSAKKPGRSRREPEQLGELLAEMGDLTTEGLDK